MIFPGRCAVTCICAQPGQGWSGFVTDEPIILSDLSFTPHRLDPHSRDPLQWVRAETRRERIPWEVDEKVGVLGLAEKFAKAFVDWLDLESALGILLSVGLNS
jgi:hypothetical protein